ncbi:hypothetical protein ABZ354_27785 [Streptomyces sp. NPDC005925]|uniref:hypothetical protein n=1 Tax=Streptomyces sp. NPDC005925 TaxID=3157172 RepID=UPI0033FF7ADC
MCRAYRDYGRCRAPCGGSPTTGPADGTSTPTPTLSPDRRVTTTTDAAGRTTRRGYDKDARVRSVTNADNNTSSSATRSAAIRPRSTPSDLP